MKFQVTEFFSFGDIVKVVFCRIVRVVNYELPLIVYHCIRADDDRDVRLTVLYKDEDTQNLMIIIK